MVKNCTMCGTVYEGESNSKYCSADCKELYNMYENENKQEKVESQSIDITYDIIKEKKHKTYKKLCKNCGKEFDGYKTTVYCSKECKTVFNKNKEKSETIKKPFEPKKLSGNLSKNNKSGYRGVYFDQAKQKWRSQIRFDGKCHKLGLYEDKLEAVRARQKAEIEFYGKILDNENFESADYDQITDYVTNMSDARLIQMCNLIYDYINNDFVVLYKQFEENISSIDELQNLFLQESNKRFYKLNKISRMLDDDIG